MLAPVLGGTDAGCRSTEIRFTGLRAGEKLTEELLPREKCWPTKDAGIYQLQPSVHDADRGYPTLLSGMETACLAGDENQVAHLLTKTVPDYLPSLGVERLARDYVIRRPAIDPAA